MKVLTGLLALILLVAPASAQEMMRPVTSYTLDFSDVSASISSGVGSQIRAVRLTATQDVQVAIGVSPVTATTTSHIFLPSGEPAQFIVGAGEYIAAIRVSANGTLYITELSK